MHLNKSQIRYRAMRLERAKLDATVARASLRQAVRATAVSPRGLAAGLVFGFAADRFLFRRQPAVKGKGKGKGLVDRIRSLLVFLPLMRFI